MAFELQTDDGSLTANAYVSAAAFKTYHDDRGNDRAGFGDSQIQRAIIRATDYLDQRFRFVGMKERTEQRTQWPRIGAVDRDGRLRSGVPWEVEEACADYALIALRQTLNPTPARDDSGRTVVSRSETVDVISESVTFDGGSYSLPKYPVADQKLKASGLVVSGVEIRRA